MKIKMGFLRKLLDGVLREALEPVSSEDVRDRLNDIAMSYYEEFGPNSVPDVGFLVHAFEDRVQGEWDYDPRLVRRFAEEIVAQARDRAQHRGHPYR